MNKEKATLIHDMMEVSHDEVPWCVKKRLYLGMLFDLSHKT
jgi:hypothetical protein